MTTTQTPVGDALAHYLIDHSEQDNSTFETVFESASKFYAPTMQISKIQAQALQYFVHAHRIKNIIEVGTFVGYSAFCMAAVLPESGTLISIEKNIDFHAQALKNLANTSNQTIQSQIQLMHGDAKKILPTLEKMDIDMLFIDGDKKHYPHYLAWATQHLKPNKHLIIDNIFFKGFVSQKKPEETRYTPYVQETIDTIKRQKQFHYCFLPVGDGMLMAQKK